MICKDFVVLHLNMLKVLILVFTGADRTTKVTLPGDFLVNLRY